MRIDLASPVDVLGFRAQSNSLLAHQVPPGDIAWEALAAQGCSRAVRGLESRPPASTTALNAIVPRSFLRLTELVVLHRDEARFDLLYRLLWRLVHEPHLVNGPADADMAQAQRMGQAVRREIFRMKAALQLRPIGELNGLPLQFGWFEPRHHVTEEVAAALARNQSQDAWLLVTPDRSVLCNGRGLLCGPGVASGAAAQRDADWLAFARQMLGANVVTGG
jgi:probable DNA metabolism protein